MRYVTALAVASLLLAVAGTAQATSGWYEVTFDGADMWNYTVYNAGQTAVQQDAPHRYAQYDTSGNRTVVATTWGTPPPAAAGDFGAWATSAAGQAYAIDEFNLWGADGLGGSSWGEYYVSVGTPHPDHGFSSWKLISAPAGWTGPNGIVPGGDSWSADEEHAFPVWRVGTGTALTQANMNDPQFVWTFDVLISNVETAFESDGSLRVWWGGWDNSSPYYDDVAGIMNLEARPIPEPVTMAGMLLGLGALGRYMRRRTA
jgi:hypothetical protein